MRLKLLSIYCMTVLFLLPFVTKASAQNEHLPKYTLEHPLIYEDIWDLPPYTFLTKEGEPAGFNIDLIKIILKRLDIPYIIRLKPTAEAYKDLQNGKSNLMLGMNTEYHSQFGQYGTSVVALFTHGIAHPASQYNDIENMEDLRKHKVIVQNNSFSHRKMLMEGMEEHAMAFNDINDAIKRVDSRDSGQVLWNTLSLKYTIKNYDLKRLTITPINMPNSEYRFMSNDTELLAMIDSVYEVMTINEELQPIRNKWFYPEIKPSRIPNHVWYIAGALALVVLMLMIYNKVYKIRESNIKRNYDNLNKRLSLYMRSAKIQMWTYDIERNVFMAFNANGETREEYKESAFATFFNPDDFNEMRKAIHELADGKTTSKTMLMRCHRAETEQRERYFDMKISVLHSKNGKPSILLGTQQDVTEERRKQLETQNLLLRFYTVFNTVKVDMAFYDSKGVLTDINTCACETLGNNLTDTNRKATISNVLRGLDFDIKKPETIYASSIIDHCRTMPDGSKTTSVLPPHIKNYEMMVLPIFHDNSSLIGYFVTGRNVTEMAANMQRERDESRLIRKGSEQLKEYMDNINYALSVSHIWLVNYYPDKRMIEITHDLKKPMLRLSQLRAVELLDNADKQNAVKLINSMDRRTTRVFSIKVKTRFKDNARRPLYLQLNGVPIYDENGRPDHYFGLCRNVSILEETEVRLREEMQKARDAETVKNTFMKNMSYEIRTPLNAVVGFAELFNMEHDPADEPIFMEEIKKNSNILLKLINDILFLSRLDADMVEMNMMPVDFAEIFGAHCMIGWNQELNSEVRTVVENNYEHLVVNIDAAMVGKVIEIVASNAAHFTKAGVIRGHFEYFHDELIISVKDTGVGIDKDTLKKLFERTELYEDVDRCSIRLGLLICKKLVEKMGGRFDMESEPDTGTTVWITIPCEATTNKKKNNLI